MTERKSFSGMHKYMYMYMYMYMWILVPSLPYIHVASGVVCGHACDWVGLKSDFMRQSGDTDCLLWSTQLHVHM